MSIYEFKHRAAFGGAKPSIAPQIGYVPPGYNPEINAYEKHVPGANYEGPGTWVANRWVKRGLRGTTATDEAARRHDIEYSNLGALKARNLITQQQLEKGIQNSDARLLRTAKSNLIGLNPLSAMHAQIAYAGIYAKKGLQNMNWISKSAFTQVSPKTPYIDEDKPSFTSELPRDYLQGGSKKRKKYVLKGKKYDRLKDLRKCLKNAKI